MNKILVIGAGRSATTLVEYLLDQAPQFNWLVTVADADLKLAEQKINNDPFGRPVRIDVTKPGDRRELIRQADVVVSLVPAHLHIHIARDCTELKKHLITASYVSEQMYGLEKVVKSRSLIFMCEMGLDPGIDHMSAKKNIDEIYSNGGRITAFRSFTGGLIAPECDDNPWHYKFTWNPLSVVLAGQGTAQYLENGKYKYIPYTRLFKHCQKVNIRGVGEYEVYPNRDSLLYRHAYGLNDVPNIIRGTIRHTGFCEAWDALVNIGLTDNSFQILESGSMTYHELLEAFLKEKKGNLKDRVARLTGLGADSDGMKKLEWLGIFTDKKIKLKQATPAGILVDVLEKKWALSQNDKDMILMQHEYEYTLEDQKFLMISTLAMKGENRLRTAMSKLVGLPLGIFTKLVMVRKINTTGVQIPVKKEVYEPVMKELNSLGVRFYEKIEAIKK